jgi:hypothetical protein
MIFEFDIMLKSRKVSGTVGIAGVGRIIENLMNLRHPCISRTIGVVLPSPLQELQIVRQHSACESL